MVRPRSARSWWLGALALGSLGCGAGAFVCTDEADCKDGSRIGQCEPSGGCSFPDQSCPSGRRYGEHASGGLAGECVPDDGVAGSDTGAGTTGASTTIDATTTSATAMETSGRSDSGSETKPVAESSTGGPDSADPTTADASVTLDSGPVTDASGSGDSTGGVTDDPYGDCTRAMCPDGSECEPLGALPLTCAPPCDTVFDCPAPMNEMFLPSCIGEGNDKWCVIPCANEFGCPDGMSCTDWEVQQYGMMCTWF